VVLFGSGKEEVVCEVASIGKGEVHLAVIERREVNTEPRVNITLCIAVGKGRKLEEIVEATTALGVSRILPFVGQRSVAQRTNPRLGERLKRIASEAARQSRRACVPEIGEIHGDLEAVLGMLREGGGTLLFLDERGGEDLSEQVGALSQGDGITLFVGPEGGWSESERTRLSERGAHPASLGPRILRTELAAAVAVALVERFAGIKQTHAL
jgi:16S rRNA (uracil1498-N3)-methyltransferase